MGYTTNFVGAIQLSRPLTIAEARTLLDIAHMSDRQSARTITGTDAYLQWVPSETLGQIVWDGGEKFYDYIQQLEWLCNKWLRERDIEANGTLTWSGEEASDSGVITVTKNVVLAKKFETPDSTKAGKPLTMRRLQQLALDQLTNTK